VSIAPWQRAQTWYSPGVTYWENDEQFARCVANYFPHREKRKHGPAFRRPCFIVELLDAHYQAEDSGLYRITVLAWGREPHTRVMLQSYWLVGKSARRLAWKEVF
jgi:Tfp pilus assembly protein PilX